MKKKQFTSWLITLSVTLIAALMMNFTLMVTDPEEEKKILEKIVTELEAGISVGNNEPWKKYMADDGILINRDGNMNTKQEIIDEVKPLPNGKILDIKPVNIKIYLQEKSAMISFIADEKLSIWGQTVDTKYPSVMYFEKRNGEWQMTFFTYFEKPVDPAPVRTDKKSLERYAGIYKVSDELKVEVMASDSGLIYKKPGSKSKGTLLYPINDNGHFFRAGTESEFIFTKDAQGKPIIRQRRNWIDLIWYKESN